ncbi:hypothetical protein K435DRAFT_840774 [Dendrothele bispora CBS 962.96]|uniref:Copper radical oxidase n=1 Tax=Dendrothele bispora (strain CBS 962.96) TaxID=1314807 RepID=A0A4S8LR93_DENBC|nr:hypothetical protein K435DRAFT_840774 [Dendrothele bispora CBS 962.96]
MRPFSPSYTAFVLAALSGLACGAFVEGDWVLTQDGVTGVSALQMAVTTETKVIILDKAEHNPLITDDGKNAMASELDLITRTVRPLNGAKSNVWCAGGGFLSNGTFINTGGNPAILTSQNGLQALRQFEPCDDQTCDIIDDSGARLRITSPRWYPGIVRLEDGSLLLMGGATLNNFINTPEINNPTYEYYPPKNINGFNGVQIPSKFLNDTMNANLFPYLAYLPDGKIFIAANTQTMIFDWKNNSERRLPDIPNGVRISYPYSGSAALLPLTPENDYTPEILICGGSTIDDTVDASQISSQTPASKQCARMVLTEEGISGGWKVEEMPLARTMGEMFILPDGRLILVNGAQTGYSGYANSPDPIGDSNADHPSFTPVVYDPEAPEGSRFSSKGIPSSDIARLYHSTATLTANGTILMAGSNPHEDLCFDQFPTEYRAEYLDPPYMFKPRPSFTGLESTIAYNKTFTLNLTMPSEANATDVSVILMDLGYSTHGVHQSSRYLKLVSELSEDGTSLTVTGPPTPQLYPPGPAYLYVVTADGVPSPGKKTLVGDGQSPPADEEARQNMFDQTPPVNTTFSQVRTPPTCKVSADGASITGSRPPTTTTGENSIVTTSPTTVTSVISGSTSGSAFQTTATVSASASNSEVTPSESSLQTTATPTATNSGV